MYHSTKALVYGIEVMLYMYLRSFEPQLPYVDANLAVLLYFMLTTQMRTFPV